jgi:hypothetical protein
MKSRKWLTYTLGALLTLLVLAAVGVAGFRVGMIQNASFTRPAFAHNFDRAPQAMQDNPRDNSGNQGQQDNSKNNGGPQAMPGNPQNRGFDNHDNGRGFDRRGGGMRFPFFGLIHLAVLALVVWIVYKLVKNSGWKLSLTKTSPAPAPVTTPSVEVEEKKESE